MDEKEKIEEVAAPVEAPVVSTSYIKPQHREVHDSSVMFEEYHYYAQKTREEQMTYESPKVQWREVFLRKKNEHESEDLAVQKLSEEILASPEKRMNISDEEWANASRAFRTTSWGACECIMCGQYSYA